MAVGDAQAFYDPIGGETQHFITAQDAKDSVAQIYTDNLQKVGGTLTGPLTLSGAPTVDLHASTKKYVDDVAATLVPKSGGTMTGLLTLSGAPSSNLHSATKLYVDTGDAVFATHQANLGNLLTANQASVEVDATGWTVGIGTPTLAQSNTKALDGTYSLRAASTTTGSLDFTTSSMIPVVANQKYTASMYVSAGTTGRNAGLYIRWYTSGQAWISSSPYTTVPTSSSAWTLVINEHIAPSNAAYAQVRYEVLSTQIGEQFYFDKMGFWRGRGGSWVLPGIPIPNLGIKITHPNTDDVLIQLWDDDKDRWQRAHYDSGVRNVSSLVINGSVTGAYMRMINGNVTLHLSAWLPGLTGNVIFGTVPWPPSYQATMMARDNTTPRLGAIDADGTTRVYNISSSSISLSASWMTTVAIPTSLPGTLVSAAPY